MTIAAWLLQAKQQLQEVAIPSVQLDSELLLSYALEKGRTWLFAHNDKVLSTEEEEKANSLLARRLKREPLAYIRGWQEFYGRRFIVASDVLIPRPESETIIELLKKLPTPPSGILIDVGTGSGALGITIQKEFSELRVVLSDISLEALEIAKRNRNALSAKATIIQSDLLQSTPEDLTIIVANLPYVDKTWERSPETEFEPVLALFAEQSGLKLILKLIAQAAEKLSTNGLLFIEADPRQFPGIKAFAFQHGFSLVASEGFILQFQKR